MAKKKILASIMAGIMAMTMAVPTFAAQIDPADCDHEFGYWRYTVKPTCTTEGKGDMVLIAVVLLRKSQQLSLLDMNLAMQKLEMEIFI